MYTPCQGQFSESQTIAKLYQYLRKVQDLNLRSTSGYPHHQKSMCRGLNLHMDFLCYRFLDGSKRQHSVEQNVHMQKQEAFKVPPAHCLLVYFNRSVGCIFHGGDALIFSSSFLSNQVGEQRQQCSY